MKNVSLADAKNRLSELVDRVLDGEEFAVTRRGKPVARLVPNEEPDPVDRRREVRESFRQLHNLCGHVQLEGDLKAIARDGLD